MYRVGKRNNAHAHGTYIKPMYLEVWAEAVKLSGQLDVSISEFVNYHLFHALTGHEPSDSRLTGRTPFSQGKVIQLEARRSKRSKLAPPRKRERPRFRAIGGRR